MSSSDERNNIEQNPDKDTPQHPVFVYGTLRKGGRNHHLISSEHYAGTYTVPGYEMWSLGAYPGIVPAIPERKVIVEYYHVSSQVLRQLDRLESYLGEQHPGNVYERIQTKATDGTDAWIYVFRETLMQHQPYARFLEKINHGDWMHYMRKGHIK